MAFQNLTPFPAISWGNVDSKKQWFITTLVRVKYIPYPLTKKGQWELRITPDQGELFGEDYFYEDNINFPVRYESDFVIFKPKTDIILNAKAQNAKNLTIKNQCSLVITDPQNKKITEKTFSLYGNHPWRNGSKKKKYPTDLGFINRENKSRLKYAGTYDKNWIDHQHPYPPNDYSHMYNQAAHPSLILDNYIQPGSKIGLSNLLSEKEDIFILPELHCFCEHIPPSGRTIRRIMNIDTVLIDIESDDSNDWAIYLSYRDYQLKTFDPKDTFVKYLPATSQLEPQHG